jgi:asparagine synthase (glutamine-hydrolysing)
VCGINGILCLRDATVPVSLDELLRTRDYMTTRGPDAAGEWSSPNGRIGLGHRRLAIIDLSPAGQQPMSREGRYWIVFNGEIYNYQELREELEQFGMTFHSHSDTEVILALYAQLGVDMLSRLRGMYAIAIWDARSETLLLARDPFGIKPLYYAADGDHLRFASQVRALEAGGAISRDPDPVGAAGFLLWGSVPEPYTIRRSVHSLPAGHYLLIEQGRVGAPCPYDQRGGMGSPKQTSVAEALTDSVRAHLVADVPVAIFLSAGLDSSLLAALAVRLLPEPPMTITVRFDSFAGTSWDEGPLAAQVASTLGTKHIERVVGVGDFPDLWACVLSAMDQPSIDGFNTYVISRIAHEFGVKVVLSGLGGDELSGGYPSFRQVPVWARRAHLLGKIPGLPSLWPKLARTMRPGQPKLADMLRYGASMPGAYYLWRGLFLPEQLSDVLGKEMAQAGQAGYNPVVDVGRHLTGKRMATDGNPESDGWDQVRVMEVNQYMRNQLLRDSDWASMAHSLELRVPFVDAWLGEQMAALRFEPARSQGKAASVRTVAPELPEVLWNRPKSGFFIPIMDWLEPARRQNQARSWGRDSRQIALRVLHEFVPDLRL